MIRHIALTVLAGVIATAPAYAGQQRTSTDAWAGGVLVSVDAADKSMLVRQGEFEQRYTLAADASVEDGKTALAADQLDKGVGRYVRVRYVLDGETRVADTVKVLKQRGSVTATTSRSTGSDKTAQP